MKRLSLFILMLIIVCNGLLQAQQKVTGGFPLNITDAPWQVLLKIGNDYACGGSIIAPNFILTAKHCVNGVSASSVKVIAGITCKDEINTGNTFNVSRIVFHPNPNIDVALLELSSNISYSNNRRAINYWASLDSSLYNIGDTVRVSGWGWLTPNGFDPANCLQAVDVRIISNQDAENALGETVGDHEVATTGIGNIRQGACHGDSGGPLTTLSASNEPILIGVVSWGRPNCPGNNTNSPSVFVRVSNVVNWIVSNIATITGPDGICMYLPETYTVSNLPLGATVTWDGGAFLSLISGQGTTMATFSRTGYGLSQLKATISVGNNTIYASRIIHSNTPSRPWIKKGATIYKDATANFTLCVGQGATNLDLTIITPDNAITGGPWVVTKTLNPENFSIIQNDNSLTVIPLKTGGGVFTIKSSNSCGPGEELGVYLTLNTCSGGTGPLKPPGLPVDDLMTISPNPASSEVAIEIADNADSQSNAVSTYTVQIVDMSGAKAFHGKKKGKKFNLSTSSLRNGTYNLIVSDGVNTYQKRLVVKH